MLYRARLEWGSLIVTEDNSKDLKVAVGVVYLISTNVVNEWTSAVCVTDISNVTDVVRQGRLRWFGHQEHRGKDEWVSTGRNVFLTGARGRE